MKKIFSIVLFFISAGNCFGQQVTFQKTFGGTGFDAGYYVQQTSDGGYIITGSTTVFSGNGGDVYLIKTDSNGNSLWTKTFGGTGYDLGRSVQQTTDGGYIIAGTINSFSAGNYDVCLIKTDYSGNLLWTKTIGRYLITWDNGISLQQTADGGYIIAGHTETSLATDEDVYLIKTDTSGNTLWTKTFGGTNDDYGYSVRQTSDGGYIIGGSTLSFGAGNYDAYLIKTDANGDSLWTKTYGGANNDQTRSIQQTTDGGYIITGFTESFGASNGDVYLIKVNSNGNLLWKKIFGGGNSEFGLGIEQTTDGGFVITGRTESFGQGDNDVYLIKTDSIGGLLWTKTFGGTTFEDGYSVYQTTDGGFVITGRTESFGQGDNDVYLIKTDSLGNSGCNEGSTATIVTTPGTQVSSPATIVTSPPILVATPVTIVGSGGIATTLCTTVGIGSAIPNPQSEFSISSNPTTNNFTITFSNTINKGSIEIYTVLGEKIFTENIYNVSQKEIHLKNITAGIYFLELNIDPDKNGASGERIVKKIVKE